MYKDQPVAEKEYYGLKFKDGHFYKVTWLNYFWPNTPSSEEIMQCRFVNGQPWLFRKGKDDYMWRVDKWINMYYNVTPSKEQW